MPGRVYRSDEQTRAAAIRCFDDETTVSLDISWLFSFRITYFGVSMDNTFSEFSSKRLVIYLRMGK